MLLLIPFLQSTFAATFYIDSLNGNDSNQNSLNSPWKSLDSISKNSNLLKPKDEIHLCGPFYGQIISSIPLSWSSCNNGATISNSFIINSTWQQYKGQIMSTPLDIPISSLLLNNQQQILARFPNVVNQLDRTGLYSQEWIQAVNSFPMDLSTWQLPSLNKSSGSLKGAIARIRTINWIYEASLIKDNTETSITFDSPLINTPPQGSKPSLYIEGRLEDLDQPGEYYHDGKTLYYYPPPSIDLSKVKLEGVKKGPIMQISAGNTIVKGLKFINGQGGISIDSNLSNIVIQNNIITSMQQFGISSIGKSTNVSILSNEISNVLRHGIFLAHDATFDRIEGNYIHDIGLIAGYGPSRGPELIQGSPTVYGNVGIYVSGSNNSILFNKVVKTGYHGIQTSGGDVLSTFSDSYNVNCSFNIIDSPCLVLSDCGGIYSRETHNSVIFGNVVANPLGNGVSDGKGLGHLAHGIYVDEQSSDVLVSKNTVYNASYTGIYIHRTNGVNVVDNVVVNNGLGKQIRPTGTNKMLDNKFVNNVYYISAQSQEFGLQQGGNDVQTPLLAKHSQEMYCATGPLSSSNNGIGQMFSVDGKTYVGYDKWSNIVQDENLRMCNEGDKTRVEGEIVRIKNLLSMDWKSDNGGNGNGNGNVLVPTGSVGKLVIGFVFLLVLL